MFFYVKSFIEAFTNLEMEYIILVLYLIIIENQRILNKLELILDVIEISDIIINTRIALQPKLLIINDKYSSWSWFYIALIKK